MIIARRFSARASVAWALIAFVAASVAFWALPEVLGTWNSRTTDRFFVWRWRSARLRLRAGPPIAYIDLNDSTLEAILSNRRVSRADVARVVDNLTSANVAAAGLDFLFMWRGDEADDRALVEALRRSGRAFIGFTFRRTSGGSLDGPPFPAPWHIVVRGDASMIPLRDAMVPSLPEFTGAAKGSGFLDAHADPDGVYRRTPLLYRFADGFYPSLGLRVVCDVLGVPPSRIELTRGRLLLRNAVKPGDRAGRDIAIPIDSHGEMRINFTGPWAATPADGGAPHYWFGQVWQASDDENVLEILRERLAGRIAMVSDVSTGAADVGVTPIDPWMPKVSLHASVIDTVLSGRFLRDGTFLEKAAEELCIVFLFAMAAVVLDTRVLVGAAAAIAGASVGLAFVVFLRAGVLLNVIRPVISVALATAFVLTHRYVNEHTARRVIRRTFEAYFPPNVVERLVREPERLTATGERKELTILFSDIKSFTTRCSSLPPDDVQLLLNTYFGAMVEVVFDHGGTVDKFIGDGLMVFFGDPDPQPDHATRAVRSAIAMQGRIGQLNAEWEKEGKPPIQVRIGINTGDVIVGNMGSSQRLSYTVLGAPVNLAQRLEANATPGGVLVSERCRELLDPAIRVRARGDITVKGLSDPVRVYDVEF